MPEQQGEYGYGTEKDIDRMVAPNLVSLRNDLEEQIAEIAGGGDPGVITDLQEQLDAVEAALAGKISGAELTASLSTKADTSVVNTKAAAADLTALADEADSRLDAAETALAGKASAASVTAATAAINAVDSSTDGRLDAIEAALPDKAPNSDITADRARLTSLEGRLYFPKARGAVAFTFDDGWDTHPFVADQMAQRGQAGTFYVTADLLSTSQHMATSAVAAIAGYGVGHEIGCHNKTHTDMTTLNASTRDEQWASKATIEALLGGKKITSYAYPLGNNNLACNQEAYGRFDRVAAIGLSQGYYTGSSGYAPWLYESDFEGFRHGRFNWSSSTHAQLMALLAVVRRRPVVLTVYTHQLDSGDSPTTTQFLEAVNYCQAAGIPCLTTADALPGPKLANPGFESGLDAWNVVPSNTAPALAAVVDVITDTVASGLSGTKSLRLQTASMTSADSVHVFQLVPVKGDTGYSCSARIRHDGTPTGAGKFSVRINEYDGMGAAITGTSRSVRGTASTGSWAQSSAVPPVDATTYVLAGRTRSETRWMTVGLYIQEYSGTFYADHVHFGPTEDGLLG